MFQSLEPRRLMAASAVLNSKGTLTVTGTEKADTIEVRLSPNFVADATKTTGYNFLTTDTIVRVNGRNIATFNNGNPATEVLRVNINGLGGDDQITGPASNPKGYAVTTASGKVARPKITASVRLWVDGGAGNDVIRGGQGNRDTLLGGAGNDRITATYGNNHVDGGAGDDVIYVVDVDAVKPIGSTRPASYYQYPDTIISSGGHDSTYTDETDVIEATQVA